MKIPLVLLPGWGNGIIYVKKLFLSFDALESDKYMFDYRYKVHEDDIDTEKGIYAPFEVMRDRFHLFLSDNNLLNNPLNLVGFSEGGMIALFTAGTKSDVSVNKYISISSPHKGAYKENFWWSNDGSVTDQFEWDSDFLKNGGDYENAALSLFAKSSKDNLLQIYSKKDVVATKNSVLRFKNFMNLFEVKDGNRWHVAMPGNPSTIGKVNAFLSV